MDLSPYIANLRRDLTAAAGAGPDEQAAAERMLLALEPAFRLSAMELLARAAEEVTAALPAGVVEVRLRGRDPEVVVDAPDERSVKALPLGYAEDVDDGAVARVTLRIPESVKARAEELAAGNGWSLNSWVVSVLRAATSRRAVTVDLDVSSIPVDDRGRRTAGRG